MAQEDERKGRSHLTDFIYFPKGYLHNASPDEPFSQSELSSFMNCLSRRLPWWAFTTVCLLPIVKIQDASSHSVIQRRHLRWLGSLLDTGNGDMKMTRSLL